MGIIAATFCREWARKITLLLGSIIVSQLLFAQKPTITSFSPASGTQRDVVVITGTNLNYVTQVYVGTALAASFKVVNSTSIEATVGASASGNVSVLSVYGTGILGGFTYTPLPAPTITSFSPAIANAGATVTINGTNFNPVADKNLVYFGTVKATVTAAGANTLSVTVPTGAGYAPISVTNNDYTAYSTQSFIETFPDGGFLLPTSFDKPVSVPADMYAAARLGDMDNDGKPDLVVSSAVGGTVSVYKNTSTVGGISFAGKSIFTAAGYGSVAAVSDLNGDGKLDVITTTSQSGYTTLSFLQNTSANGVLSFSKKDYSTGVSSTKDLAVMDVDGDGRPDVAVVHNDNTLSVFRNRSDFLNVRFDYQIDFPLGDIAGSISINDLDGDGKPDIAVTKAATANALSVLKNNSTPGVMSLAAPVDVPIANSPEYVTTGDLDKDGKPELVAVSYDGYNRKVSIFKNNSTAGSFSFGSEIGYSAGIDVKGIAISDMEGDGRPDIVTANYNGTYAAAVFRNIGTSSIAFADYVPYATGTSVSYGVNIGDVDGDGLPDLALADGAGSTVSVIRNRTRSAHITGFSPLYGGPGTVVTIKGYNLNSVTGVTFGGAQAASYTKVSDTVMSAIVGSGATGSINAAATYGSATIAVFNYSNVPLINTFTPAAGAIGTTVTITGANFNTVPASNTVYFGSVKAPVVTATANAITVTVPPGANSKPLSVTTNGLTAYSGKSFTVTFPGAPATIIAGSFETKQEVPVGQTVSVQVADIDLDGKADLLAADNVLKKVSVFRNTGKPGSITFAARVDLAALDYTNLINTCDFNGDGKLDVVTGGTSVRVYMNTSTPGNISFAAAIDLAIDGGIMTVSDIDIDGKPDIVVIYKNVLSVYTNTSANGNISFSGKNIITNLYGTPRVIAFCDFNNDLKPDLVLANISENAVWVFANNSTPGHISLADYKKYDTGTPSIDGLATSDVDNDGRPDITLVNVLNSSYSVIRNSSDTAIAFEKAIIIPSVFEPTDLAMGDVDGDGKQDVAIVNGGGGTGNSTSISKNLSNSTIGFASRFEFAASAGPSDVNVSDLDGDGKPELVVACFGCNAVDIYRNRINEPVTVPSGASPVSGNVQTNTMIDASVQTYNNQPYVQRHYEIEPENNAATATATVTLFFSQQDFDNYNAYPGHNGDLPKSSADAAGIANLRVYQYHGFSATSVPGSYNGGGVEIDPADNNIIWNPVAQWWEVTFPINGFSGFFVSSAGFKYQQPPALTASTTGATVFCAGNNVTLNASTAANYQWYKDGIVINNATAATYQATQSGTYTVTTSVSNVASIPSNGIAVTVKPAPVKPVVTQNGTTLSSSAAAGNQWYKEGVLLTGETNKTYNPAASGDYSVIVTVNGCTSAASDAYHYVLTGIINIGNDQYVRLDPNPVTSQAILTFNITGTPALNVQVIDMSGVVYRTFNGLASGARLPLGQLARGIYMAKIFDPNKRKQYVFKFMKL